MSKNVWNPKTILRVEESDLDSSTNPVIVQTDQGRGYFKVLGNPEGPQVLACEYVGTSLARILGLPTFEFCIFTFSGSPEIVLHNGMKAEQGAGFLTREEKGIGWDGTSKQLKKIRNQDDITRLVCVDTWTRNQDRYFPRDNPPSRRNLDNVFLQQTPKSEPVLKAIDFTHAFTNGRDVTVKLTNESRDTAIYGLFPEFKKFLKKEIASEVCLRLKSINKNEVEKIIHQIPCEWEIDAATKTAWTEFIVARAHFLSDSFLALSGLEPNEKQKTLF